MFWAMWMLGLVYFGFKEMGRFDRLARQIGSESCLGLEGYRFGLLGLWV